MDKETLTVLFGAAVLIVAILIILCFSTNAKLKALQGQIPVEAQKLYQQWRNRDIESIRTEQKNTAQREASAQLQSWKVTEEYSIRQDAINRSRAVITGKVTEHLAPYLPTFPFNPKESRFIGAPIDIIVFDGMDDGDLRGIVFVEVKTGKSALSPKQRQIREAVLANKVYWREWRVD